MLPESRPLMQDTGSVLPCPGKSGPQSIFSLHGMPEIFCSAPRAFLAGPALRNHAAMPVIRALQTLCPLPWY
jgi:hypothetical protein